MTDRERLIQLLDEAEDLPRCQTYEGFADYLIENGVVVPPCKIGQFLWRINWKYQIEPCHVSMLTQKSNGSFKLRISPLHGAAFEITPGEIGKYVFLSREEAERAVKGDVGK